MKILADLHGKPMLSHVLERAAMIKGVDQVVLAVPKRDVACVSHLWPHVYGGSEKDVLSRYAEAANEYEADVIVRITGDCCLLAPDLLSWAVGKYTGEHRFGYMPICQPYQKVADGWDGELFTRHALLEANKLATKLQREHVTTYFRGMVKESYCSMFLDETIDFTALKCSVDTREDLARVEMIMNHLEDKNNFSHQATWNAWERAGRPW
jgi:spore coat polysaccharide biosynthesis protein SpsF (cytidylyltransferase family)